MIFSFAKVRNESYEMYFLETLLTDCQYIPQPSITLTITITECDSYPQPMTLTFICDP